MPNIKETIQVTEMTQKTERQDLITNLRFWSLEKINKTD